MSNHIDKIIPMKNIIGPSSKNKITPIKKIKIIIALLSFKRLSYFSSISDIEFELSSVFFSILDIFFSILDIESSISLRLSLI